MKVQVDESRIISPEYGKYESVESNVTEQRLSLTGVLSEAMTRQSKNLHFVRR